MFLLVHTNMSVADTNGLFKIVEFFLWFVCVCGVVCVCYDLAYPLLWNRPRTYTQYKNLLTKNVDRKINRNHDDGNRRCRLVWNKRLLFFCHVLCPHEHGHFHFYIQCMLPWCCGAVCFRCHSYCCRRQAVLAAAADDGDDYHHHNNNDLWQLTQPTEKKMATNLFRVMTC